METMPTTTAMMLTLGGAATATYVLTQWFKRYLPDWRWTNLCCLLIAEALVCLAQFIAAGWRPSDDQMYSALLIGFFGASVSTFGHELVSNIGGKLGFGERAKS